MMNYNIKARKALAICAVALVASLTGCKHPEDKYVGVAPNKLYNDALSELVKSNFTTAIEMFDALERDHPASEFAPEAQIRKAYAMYRDEKYDEAIIVIDDFARYHPNHSSISYMHYLKALCYYNRIVDIGRDQHMTEKAIDALQVVENRFPHTDYAKDAKLKRDFAVNSLAGKEMAVGRFYLKRHKFAGALNRFKVVLDDYGTSMFVPEALYRMTEAYLYMGVADEAQKHAAILGHNFPQDKWYKAAYKLMEQHNKENTTRTADNSPNQLIN
jgi:outer membrane protein assembly factor BamD